MCSQRCHSRDCACMVCHEVHTWRETSRPTNLRALLAALQLAGWLAGSVGQPNASAGPWLCWTLARTVCQAAHSGLQSSRGQLAAYKCHISGW